MSNDHNRAICTCVLITILSLGGISILVAWLADRMRAPTFTIDRATISGYNLTANNLLNATFYLLIRSHNCDPKYSIKYEVIVVTVYHNDGFTLAYDDNLGGPFVQAHGDDITFKARPTAQNVSVVGPHVAGELRRETGEGELRVEVGVRAKLRFEVQAWKHRNYILKVVCAPVVIDLNSGSSKNLTGTICT